MRALLSFVCLLIATGCSRGPVTRSSDSELQRLVGQSVTLSGRFELAGKVGPYIHHNSEPVYLVPRGSFALGPDYERMQGKMVSVVGILHFQHFERSATNDLVAQPFDYFYFDAETAQVRLQ